MTSALSAIFILVGAILTFPASFAVWEQRTLTNEERFVELGQDVFRDEAVQEVLTKRINDEVAEVARLNNITLTVPRLTGLPIQIPGIQIPGVGSALPTEQLTRSVVTQLPDSVIGQQVLVATHRAMLGVIRDDETLTTSRDEIRINIFPAIDQVLNAFSTFIPQLGNLNLPQGTGEIVVVQKDDVGFAFDAARWFDGNAIFIVILPLIAFGVAFAIATNRQQALSFIGLAIIITAALRIVIFEGPLRSNISDRVVDNGGVRAAAVGVYDVFSASMVSQELLILALGIGLVVASIVWWGLKRSSASY